MSTEAPHHGHAAAAGKPTTGRNTAETIAAPIEISTVVASGSSPRLMVAFQPAWHAAANSTAAKTSGSMARIILNVCGRSAGDRHLLPRLGETGCVVGRQSALDPIVAGDARAKRHARRHDRAHRPRDFEGIAHARG